MQVGGRDQLSPNFRERVSRLPCSRGDFDPPLSIRLLVLQPTPFCNISCDYCYLAGRDHRHQMSVDVAEAAVANAAECGLLSSQLSVVWHAGEPLAAPRRFFIEAFERMSVAVGSDVAIHHSIQTNGTLVDDRWCDLFERYSVRVGVSLDGPAFLHDAHRRGRDGRPTHARVMRGIDVLRRRGIPFHVIAVVTRDALDHADALADFFLAEGIADVGFNIDEQEGVNASSSLDGEDARFEAFLSRLFQRAAADTDRFRVREFRQACDAIVKGRQTCSVSGCEIPYNEQVLPFAITSVDWRGNFSCFSPELIDQSHFDYGTFVFGNVMRDRVTDALASDQFKRVFYDILEGVSQCERTCEFFSLCGGGAPVNKLSETGTFRSAATQYCLRTLRQPVAAALDQIERLLPKA